MTFKKNFPPQFAQCVFKKNNTITQINGLDYDLILWLNYHCSYEWDMNKSLNVSNTTRYYKVEVTGIYGNYTAGLGTNIVN